MPAPSLGPAHQATATVPACFRNCRRRVGLVSRSILSADSNLAADTSPLPTTYNLLPTIDSLLSHLFRHDVRRAISAAQELVGLVVADHLFGRRIKIEHAAQDVRGVGQVDERAGDVTLLDGRAQVLFLAAANAVDEIGEVMLAAVAFGSGRHFLAHPGLVGVVAVHGHATFRPVEDVPDGVVRSGLGSEFGCGAGALL